MADVAQRLQQNNRRLPADKALWLAAHWSAPDADGRRGACWLMQRTSASTRCRYRAADAIATWQRITAPLLWVQGAGSRLDSHWGGRYSLAEFQQRLAQVCPACAR
jgi:hypothetical protein